MCFLENIVFEIFDESLLCDVENDEEMRQIPIEPNADFAYKDYSLVDESVLKELPQALRDVSFHKYSSFL